MAFCQEVGAVPLDSVVTFNSNLSATQFRLCRCIFHQGLYYDWRATRGHTNVQIIEPGCSFLALGHLNFFIGWRKKAFKWFKWDVQGMPV